MINGKILITDATIGWMCMEAYTIEIDDYWDKPDREQQRRDKLTHLIHQHCARWNFAGADRERIAKIVFDAYYAYLDFLTARPIAPIVSTSS